MALPLKNRNWNLGVHQNNVDPNKYQKMRQNRNSSEMDFAPYKFNCRFSSALFFISINTHTLRHISYHIINYAMRTVDKNQFYLHTGLSISTHACTLHARSGKYVNILFPELDGN